MASENKEGIGKTTHIKDDHLGSGNQYAKSMFKQLVKLKAFFFTFLKGRWSGQVENTLKRGE